MTIILLGQMLDVYSSGNLICEIQFATMLLTETPYDLLKSVETRLEAHLILITI